MLKQLRISNIILIENAELNFESALNVLTGETGSGKSAIMHALSLIAGGRADSSLLRKGSEKGFVEASFDLEDIPLVRNLLEEGGIDHHPEEELILRREIASSGKTRAYINNQLAQVTLLKKVGDSLIEIVSQHANQRLFSIENHRDLIDIFGGLQDKVKKFAQGWEEESTIKKKLQALIDEEAQRLRLIEVCRMELEELQNANLKEGEEEELFSEFTLLTNSEELSQHVEEASNCLTGEKASILTLLKRLKSSLEQLIKIDPVFSEAEKSCQNAFFELQEISYTLRNYGSHIESNPRRVQELDERLSLLNRLKRKYGATFEEVNSYFVNTQEKLALLENADNQIEEFRTSLVELEKQNNAAATELTEARTKAAKKFEKDLVQQLRKLNMPKVQFEVEITPQKRNATGDDRIEFFLIPNVGEHRVAIRECASGGEISRIMLALQSLLAGKEKIPTLIFDEIDANIGGETASVVGEELKHIGTKHQVLCITHFPQVACQALHHLQISKHEVNGRTVTLVQTLDSNNRDKELARMSGKTGKSVN